MCGIAGVIQKAGVASRGLVELSLRLAQMTNAIQHRGPDDWGRAFFGFAEDGDLSISNLDEGRTIMVHGGKSKVALGHRRLSILDLSPAARQPMASHDKRYWITFNGEIYNYIELREDLRRDFDFRTTSDTEVLLASYAKWGKEMLLLLDGIFALAIWDRIEEQLFLARDPFGVKPLYYGETTNAYYLASEPQAVLAGMQQAPSLNAPQAASFLLFGLSDHSNETFYREIKQLRGGEWAQLDCRRGIHTIQRYWHKPVSPIETHEDCDQGIWERLAISVERQLRSDVPVGGCLSGGLDSGAIVAHVGRLLKSEASNFTALTLRILGFVHDESNQAKLAADIAGINWISVQVDKSRITEDLLRMATAMGEPFSGLSMFAQFKVMEAASTHGLKVMLDGQGGDEVYVGYPRVARLILNDYLKRRAFGSAWDEVKGLHNNNTSLSYGQLLLFNLYFDHPALMKLYNMRIMRKYVNPDLLETVSLDVWRGANRRSLFDVQYDELTRSCLPRLLKSEDRMSMNFGIEARVPHLSFPLVEYALKMPVDWKVRGGWTKFALRKAMSNHLPEEVVWNRRKLGFAIPQSNWLLLVESIIAGHLKDLPSDSPINVERVLRAIRTREASSLRLWRVISLGLWMRLFSVRT